MFTSDGCRVNVSFRGRRGGGRAWCTETGVRRRSFDSGEIKRAADGGASIDCCCNYNAILAQSQMKLFRTELAADANVLLRRPERYTMTFSTVYLTG